MSTQRPEKNWNQLCGDHPAKQLNKHALMTIKNFMWGLVLQLGEIQCIYLIIKVTEDTVKSMMAEKGVFSVKHHQKTSMKTWRLNVF